jgi:hypothetical protein
MSNGGNICTRCGVCCATYRVSFLRHELDSEPGGWVPAALTEAINDRGVCMRGTKDRPRRCLALQGTLGVDAHCSICEKCPSPCRAFAPEAGSRTRGSSLR